MPSVATACGAAALAQTDDKSDIDQLSCPVCLDLLCEPVPWPGCLHSYCFACAARTRRRRAPCCPLCRAPAPRATSVSELPSVDEARADEVRRAAGVQRYEARKSDILEEVEELSRRRSLGILPLLEVPGCRVLPAGCRRQLRLLRPRDRELARKCLELGGSRKLAVVPLSLPGVPQCGAHGRVCEAVHGERGSDGRWRLLVVDAGPACRVLAVSQGDNDQGSSATSPFCGELEELDEEDLPDVSLVEQGSPPAAAEMLDVLGTIAHRLRTMRTLLPTPPLVAGDIADAATHVDADQQAQLGAAVQVNEVEDRLEVYRRVVADVGQLLGDAAQTVERLGFARAGAGRSLLFPDTSDSSVGQPRAASLASAIAPPAHAPYIDRPAAPSMLTVPHRSGAGASAWQPSTPPESHISALPLDQALAGSGLQPPRTPDHRAIAHSGSGSGLYLDADLTIRRYSSDSSFGLPAGASQQHIQTSSTPQLRSWPPQASAPASRSSTPSVARDSRTSERMTASPGLSPVRRTPTGTTERPFAAAAIAVRAQRGSRPRLAVFSQAARSALPATRPGRAAPT